MRYRGTKWHSPSARVLPKVTVRPSRSKHAVLRADDKTSRLQLAQLQASASREAVLLAQGDDKDAPPRNLGPHGPRLPPRQKSTTARRAGAGGRGGGGSPSPGPGPGPGPSGSSRTERSLATLCVYSGLVGTTAVALSGLAGIDLWEAFDWSELDDLQLALAASLPLQLANVALLLPSYSSFRLPDLGRPEDNLQVQRAAANAAARAASPGAAAPAATPSTSTAAAAASTAVSSSESGASSNHISTHISSSAGVSAPGSSGVPLEALEAEAAESASKDSSGSRVAAAAALLSSSAQAGSSVDTGAELQAASPSPVAASASCAAAADAGASVTSTLADTASDPPASSSASASPLPTSLSASSSSSSSSAAAPTDSQDRAGRRSPALGDAASPPPVGVRGPVDADRAGPSNSPQAPQGVVPAAAWGSGGASGQGGGGPAWVSDLTDLRSALHLAQGYYINNNPTAKLSPAAEAAVALVDTAAAEMLFRGVALTWLAGWLEDRISEAGLEEPLRERLPAALGALGGPGLQDAAAFLGVHGACECAVAVTVAASVAWSVLARSRRAVRQLESVMAAVAPRGGSGGSGGGGAAPSGTTAISSSQPQQPQRGRQQQEQQQAQQLASGVSVAGVSAAGAVMHRAATIQATRDAAQVLLLNVVFIATGGNLAASYTAALVNQLVISALQRRGVRRIRERSVAMARELKAYNDQVLEIAAKYKDKLPEAAAAKLDAMAASDSSPPPPPGAPGSAAPSGHDATEAAAPPSGLLPPLPLQQQSPAPAHALHSAGATSTPTTAGDPSTAGPAAPAPEPAHQENGAAAAAASSSAGATAGAAVAQAALAVGGEAGSAGLPRSAAAGPSGKRGASVSGGDGGAVRRTGLESTIAMLEKLVPEPPRPEVASASSRGSQQARAGVKPGGAGAGGQQV